MVKRELAIVAIVIVISVSSAIAENPFAALRKDAKEFISAISQIKVIEEPTNPDVGQGRGNHALMKIAVPLIAGFKAASMVVAALVTLKGLLLKSLALSSMAMFAAATMAFKYLYDKVQQPSYEPAPYYNQQGWGNDAGLWPAPSSYDFQGAGLGHEYGHAGVDLHGHFSEPIPSITGQNRTQGVYQTNAQRKSVPVSPGVRTTLYKTTLKRYDAGK